MRSLEAGKVRGLDDDTLFDDDKARHADADAHQAPCAATRAQLQDGSHDIGNHRVPPGRKVGGSFHLLQHLSAVVIAAARRLVPPRSTPIEYSPMRTNDSRLSVRDVGAT